MNPDELNNENLDELSKEELKQMVRKLRFETKEAEELTKPDILEQLKENPELGLTEDDFTNVKQKYNIGLQKSGWLKIYHFVQENTGQG